MKINNMNAITTKTCPFLGEKCISADCGIFNEKFERCEVGLLGYNLYLLATAIKQQPELKN
jgi:hypothetical protein